jgi:hypothetical protein
MTDRAALYRGVFGQQDNRAPEHPTRTPDQAIGWYGIAAGGIASAREGTNFSEAAWVAKSRDALPCGLATAGVLSANALLAAHGLGTGLPVAQLRQQ